jgi:hypothetical protein
MAAPEKDSPAKAGSETTTHGHLEEDLKRAWHEAETHMPHGDHKPADQADQPPAALQAAERPEQVGMTGPVSHQGKQHPAAEQEHPEKKSLNWRGYPQ